MLRFQHRSLDAAPRTRGNALAAMHCCACDLYPTLG